MVLSKWQITKTLIRLHVHAGWSASLSFAYGINRFSHDAAHFTLSFINLQGYYDAECMIPPGLTVYHNDGKFSDGLTRSSLIMVCTVCHSVCIFWTHCLMVKPHEPRHDKTNKVSVRPAKTQISLGICPVWSESSLSAWRNLGSLATHWAHSEDSDQTGRMPRLIWVFAGRTLTLLVLSCRIFTVPVRSHRMSYCLIHGVEHMVFRQFHLNE